jgi:hypothetical protein
MHASTQLSENEFSSLPDVFMGSGRARESEGESVPRCQLFRTTVHVTGAFIQLTEWKMVIFVLGTDHSRLAAYNSLDLMEISVEEAERTSSEIRPNDAYSPQNTIPLVL